MDQIPPWVLESFQKLPDPVQERLMQSVSKMMSEPFYIPLASIPVVYVLGYVPHFAAATVKALVKGPTGYNNDCPREDDNAYPRIIKRLSGAHLNALEMFPVYAAAILVAKVRKVKATEVTPLVMAHIKLRLLYTLLYALGVNKVIQAGRTVVWTLLVRNIFELFGKAL